MSPRRTISPSKAEEKATGMSILVILILMSRASRLVALNLVVSVWMIRLLGTRNMLFSSVSLVTTGKPSWMAPAPQATVMSSTGA